MKRHRTFIAFFLFWCLIIPKLAVSAGTNQDLEAGKLFLYTAKRMGIPILKASLLIGNTAENKNSYKIRVDIVTVNVGLLFRMNNHFTSTFDGNTGVPLQYVKDVDQGGLFIKTKNYVQTLTFDFSRNIITIENKGDKEKKEVSVPKDTFDPLSMFARYYLKEGMPLNQDIRMTIFDGVKVRSIVFHSRPEKISTEMTGEVEAVLVESTIAFGSFENKEGTIRIWYSKDSKRTPLRMELDLPVGKIQFELDEIKEVKKNKIKE
jgi:hypothetical protein